MRVLPNKGTIHPGGAYLFRRTTQGNVLHAGVDISAPRGTQVVAPADGVVVAVERQNRSPFTGYDPMSVVVLDDDGLYHLLAHMEPATWPIDPRDPDHLTRPVAGERVAAGQVLGEVGKFNHTHWELRRKFLKGDPMDDDLVQQNTIDPLLWLAGVPNVVPLGQVNVSTHAPPAARPPAPAGNSGGALWIVLLLAIALSD